jgi:TetR/AcrR family transcriptional regulator, tetracycline repressor protein
MSARRAGQQRLTRARITEAALRIVDAEGLDALSMRRLGSALDVDPSSIYYHVPSKSALYDLVMDAVMSGVDLHTAESAESVRSRLLATALAYHDALLKHPNALPLLASRPLSTPESLRPAEYALGVFVEAGLMHERAISAVNALGYFVLGATVTYASQIGDSAYRAELDESRYAELPAAEFPHTTAIVAEGTRALAFQDEFVLGAEALVDGLLGTLAPHKPRDRKK